jgi:hypothetical protein
VCVDVDVDVAVCVGVCVVCLLFDAAMPLSYTRECDLKSASVLSLAVRHTFFLCSFCILMMDVLRGYSRERFHLIGHIEGTSTFRDRVTICQIVALGNSLTIGEF